MTENEGGGAKLEPKVSTADEADAILVEVKQDLENAVDSLDEKDWGAAGDEVGEAIEKLTTLKSWLDEQDS
jgi:hypothetical protein